MMLQFLHYVSKTSPEMTILQGIKNNFSGFFDCRFLDGGVGRFRFVGYLYESFIAHMQFLGKIPIQLYDIVSLLFFR